MKKVWCLDPQSGGTKIPLEQYPKIIEQVNEFSKTRSWYPRLRIQIRFKNQFCYVDLIEKNEDVSPLCRLRYFRSQEWSMGFFSWGRERYEACIFSSGKWFGSIEDAIKLCEFSYLN